MVKLRIYILLAVLSLLGASCSPVTGPATPTSQPTLVPTLVPTLSVENTPTSSGSSIPLTDAEVPRVSVEDAVAAIKSGEAIVVDVRSPQAYQASHIPGALSISLGDIEMNPAGVKLDKDKWIITYCT